MARLNLICNGMMLFNEQEDGTVQIIVPDICGHLRKFCGVPNPTQSTMMDLPTAAYDLIVPVKHKVSLRSMLSPEHYLFLDNSVVSLDQAAAAKVSAIVTVPMPSLVRLFRASEPSGSVFGGTIPKAAFARPGVHHDIVVFSYCDLSAGTKVAMGVNGNPPLAVATLSDTDILNWIVYSTEEYALAIGAPPHSTDALNNLLTFDGQKTDFSLSGIGKKDGAHSTGIGIMEVHMSAIHELPKLMGGPTSLFVSGDLGCSGGAIGG